jgi:hypothetical protein
LALPWKDTVLISTIAVGVVTDVYPEKRDGALVRFPSFEMETDFISRMSGEPIFDQSFELCGLVCSGHDDTAAV